MCGSKPTRELLVSFNILFLVVSLGLIGIGSWIIADLPNSLKFAPEAIKEDKLLIQDVGIASISIGIISAIVSFVGCCGAARESRRVLFSFMILMFVIFLAILVSGIVAVARQGLVYEVVRKTLVAESHTNASYSGMLLETAHRHYNCCGIEDLVTGCDRDYPPHDICVKGSLQCQHGCLEYLWNDVFSPYMRSASIVLFCLSGVVLIGIALASILFRSVGKRMDYSYVRQD